METKNAVIKSAVLTNDEHGCLSVWLHLDYGGSGQGFGGYSLYTPNSYGKPDDSNHAGMYIWRILEIAGVHNWSDLAGQTIRVKAERKSIEAIGHILNDDWFNPKEEFKEG